MQVFLKIFVLQARYHHYICSVYLIHWYLRTKSSIFLDMESVTLSNIRNNQHWSEE